MRLLVITRAYPPSIGGMQEHAFQLIRYLKRHGEVFVIAHAVPKWLLPFFIIYAFIKSCLVSSRVDLIHLCDAALTPLALVLKKITGKPVTVSVHGLDVTFPHPLYQRVVIYCLRRMEHIFCNSHATRTECLKRGVASSRMSVVTPGVMDEWYQPEGRSKVKSELLERYGVAIDNKILLSIGRLVKRKGFQWFITQVMPNLLSRRKDIVFLLAGQGPMEQYLTNLISQHHLTQHVILLGKIPDRSGLVSLYNAADVFIMPNICVNNDPEGFGIVSVEAASCGVPVVASKLDGIPDAVIEGKNGLLIEPGNVRCFAQAIESILDQESTDSRVREYTLKYYDWSQKIKEHSLQFERIHATR